MLEEVLFSEVALKVYPELKDEGRFSFWRPVLFGINHAQIIKAENADYREVLGRHRDKDLYELVENRYKWVYNHKTGEKELHKQTIVVDKHFPKNSVQKGDSESRIIEALENYTISFESKGSLLKNVKYAIGILKNTK